MKPEVLVDAGLLALGMAEDFPNALICGAADMSMFRELMFTAAGVMPMRTARTIMAASLITAMRLPFIIILDFMDGLIVLGHSRLLSLGMVWRSLVRKLWLLPALPGLSSASLWLTDYLLAESLRASYEARANAEAADAAAYSSQNESPVQQGGQASLSPEVKQLIADEVQRQLAAERTAAAQPIPSAQNQMQAGNNQPEETPAALDPNQRVFVVSSNVDLVGDSGECSVTAGDVLIRSGEPNGTRIGVNVVSSKKGDCAVGTNSDVEISELQEMHNQFREKMDSGLKTLADNQGKNGLPKAPDTGTTAGEVPAPQPDADTDSQLQDQQKDAESTEKEIQKAPGGN